MAAAKYDHLFKFLFVGDSGVGKTSILLRFTDDSFDPDTRNTIGVDLKVKFVDWEDKKIKLTIWDTAGQERFRTLTSAYYRGAHGIIMVYDVTQRESFENIQEWLKEVDIYSTQSDAVKLLIGNKIDMGGERNVSTREGLVTALTMAQTSAKTAVGVKRAFHELLQKIFDFPSLIHSTDREPVVVDRYAEDEPSEPCGCL